MQNKSVLVSIIVGNNECKISQLKDKNKIPNRLLIYWKELRNQNVNLCESDNLETQHIFPVCNSELTRTIFPVESR